MSYPALADELEPLLSTAEKLRAIPKPVLSPEAKARIEERVLAAAEANPRLLPVGRRRRALIVLPGWRWAFSALTAIFVLVFLLTTTLVTVSAGALPDSALYPVKLATEDVWLWVMPERDRPKLHLRLAYRRLNEIKGLAEQGTFDELVVRAMTAQVEAALDGADDLPPVLALPVLDQLTDLLGEQQQAMLQLLEQVPVASRQYLETALRASERQGSRVEALKNKLGTYEPAISPERTSTFTPGETLGLTETLHITATLTPTRTLAPSLPLTLTTTVTPTVTPTEPPASQPSSGTGPTATAPPPPPPTATQPPPPTATQPPPPTATQPPPEPTATSRVPPGLTNTPTIPGHTRTPKPTKTPKP